MFAEDNLVESFLQIVNRLYPSLSELLEQCHIRLLTSRSDRTGSEWQYIGIFCPRTLLPKVKARQRILQDVARHLGLVEASCLNATAIVYDPQSNLREADPSLWLELNWLVSAESSRNSHHDSEYQR